VSVAASETGDCCVSSSASSLLPSVCRRFSRPSTRFKRASSTSVLGPLFLGTASGVASDGVPVMVMVPTKIGREGYATVNTWAVEDLARLARRTCPVALDLEQLSTRFKTAWWSPCTLRLRQLLQFMASRGSVEARRVGRRSMPICGLDIAKTGDCETAVDMSKSAGRGQDACLVGAGWFKRHRRHDKRQEMQRVRCEFKLRPLASAQAVGNSARAETLDRARERQGLKHPAGVRGHRYDSVVPAPEALLDAAGESWEGHMTISSSPGYLEAAVVGGPAGAPLDVASWPASQRREYQRRLGMDEDMGAGSGCSSSGVMTGLTTHGPQSFAHSRCLAPSGN
jgi:hypothetical protein